MKKAVLRILMLSAIPIPGIGYWVYGIWSEAATVAKFSQMEDMKSPMTLAQVEASVGRPSHIESSETTGVTAQVYHYPYLGGEMKIVFVNDVIFHTEYIPRNKP